MAMAPLCGADFGSGAIIGSSGIRQTNCCGSVQHPGPDSKLWFGIPLGLTTANLSVYSTDTVHGNVSLFSVVRSS